MLKIIQTIKSTIDGIPFDQLENEEDEFEKVQVGMALNSVMATPDPLDEEDEQKLKELLERDAPFEKIRNFIEYLRCKNQDIFCVVPMRDSERGDQFYIRGRRFHFVAPIDPKSKGRHPNTSTFGPITQHID